MKPLPVVIGYFGLSLIVLLTAKAIVVLPAGVSLAIVCLLGPIGAIQYLGLNFWYFLKPAMGLYLPAALLLGGALFLATRKRRSLGVSGYLLASIVWVLSGYVMRESQLSTSATRPC